MGTFCDKWTGNKLEVNIFLTLPFIFLLFFNVFFSASSSICGNLFCDKWPGDKSEPGFGGVVRTFEARG